MKLLIVLAIAPLVLVAGANAAETAGSCEYQGGETQKSAIPLPPKETGRSASAYLFASSTLTDGTTGVWTESNGRPGLQTSQKMMVCPASSYVEHEADSAVLDAGQ